MIINIRNTSQSMNCKRQDEDEGKYLLVSIDTRNKSTETMLKCPKRNGLRERVLCGSGCGSRENEKGSGYSRLDSNGIQ